MFFSSHQKSSDSLLMLSVFIVASCGLAYELIAGALASYVLGDSVLQFSTVIGCYLFAMGLGSHLSQYVPEQRLLQRFIEVEILVGLVGGLSAIFLFLAFAWLPEFKMLLYSVVFIIGLLVGMEIPLVMRILNTRKKDFKQLISRVLTFDYLGALIVSLLFPLLLAPHLGLARSALLFGFANVCVAAYTMYYFFTPPKKQKFNAVEQNLNHYWQKRFTLQLGVSLLLLSTAMIYAEKLIKIAEQKRFKAPVIYALSSPYQRLVITKRKGHIQLFLNGNLQFSSRDEYRYHEALVHPIMQNLHHRTNATKPDINVLILGGGDGMAAREVLKYPEVAQITLVDLDKKMTDAFTHRPRFAALNNNSLQHHKVKIINADAYRWLSQANNPKYYDAVIIDLPDPSQYSLAKLYSLSMYQLLQKHLNADALVVVQATSPYYAPRSFWSINQTLQAAQFSTIPYHTYVPSFGEWGFIIAQQKGKKHFHIPSNYYLPMKFLTPAITQAMFHFAGDMKPIKVQANTLDKQPLVRYYQQDWAD